MDTTFTATRATPAVKAPSSGSAFRRPRNVAVVARSAMQDLNAWSTATATTTA